ncbi:MAG: LTA synthase family protein [Planctomycetota bacterium]
MSHLVRSLRAKLGRHSLAFALALLAWAWFSTTRALLVLVTARQTGVALGDLPGVFLRGALFDLLFVAYAATPLVLWAALLPERAWRWRLNRGLVWAMSFGCLYGLLFVTIAEALFWEEFGARFNFIAVDYLVYTHEVIDNIFESYPMVPILLGLGAVAGGLLWLGRRIVTGALAAESSEWARFVPALGLLLFVVVTVQGIDQRVGRGAENPFVNELASNGPYQFFAAFRNNELDFAQFYPTIDDAQADRVLRAAIATPRAEFTTNAPFAITRRTESATPQERLNVVLVMVESLSGRFLARYGNQDGLTPHLDALAGQSLTFDQFYATGTRTTRGLEAVTLSIPPTPGRSIVKRIGRETGFTSLGTVLGQNGYDAKFIYGGRGYFDNMNAFFAGNGYGIVDQNTVAKADVHFENAWGMSDEDLYSQVLREADAASAAARPFFFHVMTTSNHRPYTFPDGRVALPSGSGRNAAVQYTDWAIHDLLERASTRPWFEDTVFVVVADHCASSAGKVDLPIERYRIPCMIFSPKHVEPAVVDTVGGQIDLAPTLLALLGVTYQAPFFGRNLLEVPANHGRALVGTYQVLGLFEGGVMTTLSPVKRIAQRVERPGQPGDGLSIDDPELLERCIAYYQGSSQFFADHVSGAPSIRAPGP